MHSMDNFKTTDAQWAKMINNFKNVKQKLLKANALFWFNKFRRINKLTPKDTS
jgi:1,4-alpha-glucan branching enzyme